MLPFADMNKFLGGNSGPGPLLSNKEYNMLLTYANFIQARLNTNIAYLNNEPLRNALGLDLNDILDEIRKLQTIAGKISIPEPVQEYSEQRAKSQSAYKK